MTLHVGDTAPPLTLALTSDAVPVDLTGATIVLNLLKPDATTATLPATGDNAGRVTGGPWGVILSVPGPWLVEAQVTWANGTVQTFGPVRFIVHTQIA